MGQTWLIAPEDWSWTCTATADTCRSLCPLSALNPLMLFRVRIAKDTLPTCRCFFRLEHTLAIMRRQRYSQTVMAPLRKFPYAVRSRSIYLNHSRRMRESHAKEHFFHLRDCDRKCQDTRLPHCARVIALFFALFNMFFF